MKFLSKLIFLFLLIVFFSNQSLLAQVKIGGTPGLAHPSAILQLDANNKGFLLPSLTNAEMIALPSPQNGLMIYNNQKNTPYIYKQVPNTWYAVASDSAEWVYDTTAKKVFLMKALKNVDSIYYDSTSRKMFFGDNNVYNNSLGQPAFPFTNFAGKYYFKSTASKYITDTTFLSPATMNIAMEVDSNTNPNLIDNNFRGLSLIALANPLATKNIGSLNSLATSTLHSGADTAFVVTGISNTTSINGKGYGETVTGIQNNVRVLNLFQDTVGNLVGIRNLMSNSAVAPYGEINYSLFGYYGTMSGFTNKVAGSAYGIFLGPVLGSKVNKNYAIYTNNGVNRFGDSLLISNTGSVTPRAILDVNSTTSMIVPTGSQAQRPATALVTGMTRYNVDNTTMETYSGAAWLGIIRNTQTIVIPVINPNNGYTATITVNNATIGSAVSVSPEVALPNLLSIAWARVSAANTVEIRVLNGNGTASSAVNVIFNIRVIQ
jgi:hypothetical protein